MVCRHVYLVFYVFLSGTPFLLLQNVSVAVTSDTKKKRTIIMTVEKTTIGEIMAVLCTQIRLALGAPKVSSITRQRSAKKTKQGYMQCPRVAFDFVNNEDCVASISTHVQIKAIYNETLFFKEKTMVFVPCFTTSFTIIMMGFVIHYY